MNPFILFRLPVLQGLLFMGILAGGPLALFFSSPTFAAEGVRWVAYGDNETGGGNRWVHRNLLEKMAEEKPAVVLHTGNLVAEGDRKGQGELFFLDTRYCV